jgi:uncharacterized membrane protein YfcA
VPGLTSRQLLYAAGIGLLAGLTSGLLGVGGGVVLVPGMVVLLGLDQRSAIANSLAAIIPIAVAGALVYYFAGPTPHVRVDLAVMLSIGGVLGALVGARLAHRLSERTLRVGFGLLVLAIALRLLLMGDTA